MIASLPTVATPKPSGDVGALYRFYGWHGCSSGEERAILDALGEKDAITGMSSLMDIQWNHAFVVDFLG